MILRFIFACLFVSFALNTIAQKVTISGNVTNSDKVPLPAVTIYILNSENGTVSDFQGNFTLSVNPQDTLISSYVGYKNDTTLVKDLSFINITLVYNSTLGPGVIILADQYYKYHNYARLQKKDITTLPTLSPEAMYNSVPGVFMQSGAPNTNKLSIRGIGSRSPFGTSKIRAYINDIPLTNGIGETNLEDINLAIIDKVEITKGPSSPLYGASLGGVIRYSTTDLGRNKTSLRSTTSYGSFNTIQTNANYNYAKENAIVSINQDILRSDGYRDNNKFARNNLSAFSQIEFGDDLMSIFVNLTNVNAEIPSFLDESIYFSNPKSAASSWEEVNGNEDYRRNQVSITHQRTINTTWKSKISGFLTTFENDERRPFNVLNQQNTSIGTRAVFTRGINENASHFNFGVEYFNERERHATYETLGVGQGNILSDNFEKRNFINLFAHGKYVYNRIGLDVGVNINSTFYNLQDKFISNGDQSGKYRYDPIISPFLSWHYSSPKHWLTYVTFSHGFSAPSLEETLTPDGIINPDIQAETGYNLELGVRKKVYGFDIDASIYTMFVNNLLVAERIGEDQFVGKNAGKTLHPGIELSVSKKHFFKQDGLYNKYILLDASYQFAPHSFSEFIDNDIDLSSYYLPGNPFHKLYVSLSGRYSKLDWNVRSTSISKMYRDDTNTHTVDGYTLVHARLSYTLFQKNNWSIKCSGQLNNITDTKHASMIIINPRSFGSSPPRYIYPGLPRNYFTGVDLAYTF